MLWTADIAYNFRSQKGNVTYLKIFETLKLFDSEVNQKFFYKIMRASKNKFLNICRESVMGLLSVNRPVKWSLCRGPIKGVPNN